MAQVYYVGVDVGTASVRAALVTKDGLVRSTADEPISIWEPQPDHYVQSSTEIWEKCCTVVKVGWAQSSGCVFFPRCASLKVDTEEFTLKQGCYFIFHTSTNALFGFAGATTRSRARPFSPVCLTISSIHLRYSNCLSMTSVSLLEQLPFFGGWKCLAVKSHSCLRLVEDVLCTVRETAYKFLW